MRKQTKLVAVLSAAALLAIGASMTSFAATRGWVQEGEDWVYLDNNGERVYNEWKRSGDNYYYLNEEGLMARDTLIHDETVEAYYYVNENGVKVMNDWKSIPNEEGDAVGDNTPDILWYYFGGTGKAERSTKDDLKVKQISGRYYAFDMEGRMASGWQKVNTDTEERLYYFGNENEGWAYTGWQFLEPDENLTSDNYDDLEWFWFDPANGRAAVDKTKYINGRYYSFDEFGVMRDDWYDDLATPPTAASAVIAYASSNGTLSSGWVYTGAMDEDDGDDYWFYLVSVKEGSNISRSVPYNYFASSYDEGDGTEVGVVGQRAKVIKNKTYFFDRDGKMLTGFVAVNNGGSVDPELLAVAGDQVFTNFQGSKSPYGADGVANSIKGRTLIDGLYYFNENGGSVEGQMLTGRTAVTTDGDTDYYYFNKAGNQNTTDNYGVALTSTVKEGYLYGVDGKCLDADDGNPYAVYKVSDIGGSHKNGWGIEIAGASGNAAIKIINTDVPEKVDAAYVVVSRTGRIKKSGTATIDGVKYTIADYKVIDTKAIDD